MAHAGQTIENPLSGERITFRKTAADTGGELLAFDLELSPDGHVPGMHVHPTQEERFEVVSGTMRFRKGLKKVTAGPGDVVVVPPGTAHKFANGGDETAQVRVEVRPALRMENLFETAVELAEDGRDEPQGHAEAARSRAVRARVLRRGPRRVPARVDPAPDAGAGGLARAQARSRRPVLHPAGDRLSHGATGGPAGAAGGPSPWPRRGDARARRGRRTSPRCGRRGTARREGRPGGSRPSSNRFPRPRR